MNITYEDTSHCNEESFKEHEKQFIETMNQLKDDFFTEMENYKAPIEPHMEPQYDYTKGNELALLAALSKCQSDSISFRCNRDKRYEDYWARVPMWMIQAAIERVDYYMRNRRVASSGRTPKWMDKRHQESLDFTRYKKVLEMFKRRDHVLEFHEKYGGGHGTFFDDAYERYKDVRWDNVYEKVAEQLAEEAKTYQMMGFYYKGYACKPSTVKGSYEKVVETLKTNPRRYEDYMNIHLSP